MVSRRKDGNHARYAVSDPSVFDLCEQVCGSVRRQLDELDAILQPVLITIGTIPGEGCGQRLMCSGVVTETVIRTYVR